MNDDGIRRTVGLAAFGVACLVGFGAVTVAARDRAAQSHDLSTRASVIELIQIQADVRRTTGAETNELMLEILGPGSPDQVNQARAERVRAQERAIAALERLADDDSRVGREAARILEAAPAALAENEAVDPIVLWDVFLYGWSVDLVDLAEVDADAGSGNVVDRVFELSLLDSVGTGLLNDTLDAEFVVRSPAVPPLLEGYTNRSEPYVRSNAGWLGPDVADPLVGSWLVSTGFLEPPADASTVDTAVEELRGALIDSDLWRQDAWVRSWAELDDPGPPPHTLDDVERRAHELDTSSRATVDALLVEERTRTETVAADLARRAKLLRGIAGILGVVALTALGTAGGTGLARGRRTREQLTTDPLTKVGNRHLLDARAARNLSDPSFDWHLVAMIDMNRFKMVNDTWGHQTGDLLLVATAERLMAVADEWVLASRSNQATVIRLGGDEFVVTFHSHEAHDPDDLLDRLRAIRSTTIESATGVAIELSFSIGHAVGRGPCDVDTLLRIADLASYEDKRTASLDLPDRRHGGAEATIVHTLATSPEQFRTTEVIHTEP